MRTIIPMLLLLTACAPPMKQPVHVIVAPLRKPTVSAAVAVAEVFPNMVKALAPLPHCSNLPPICAGGLVKQPFTATDLNDYTAKYSVTNCRWTEPPRCGTTEIRTCVEQCTP